MPSLAINTNVAASAIPSSFLTEMTSLIAKLVGKPEKYIAVNVNPGQMMTFEGTPAPCALSSFHCIGKIGLEENKTYTAAFMEKINKDLGIPMDRMYINYHDMERQNVGWNGKTFAA